jgi:hypothetical protein
VQRIREAYPDPNGSYTGYKPSTFDWNVDRPYASGYASQQTMHSELNWNNIYWIEILGETNFTIWLQQQQQKIISYIISKISYYMFNLKKKKKKRKKRTCNFI